MELFVTGRQVKRMVAGAALAAMLGLGALEAAIPPQTAFAQTAGIDFTDPRHGDEANCDEVGHSNQLCDHGIAKRYLGSAELATGLIASAPSTPSVDPALTAGLDVTDPRHGDDVDCDEVGHSNQLCDHGIAKRFLA